VNFSKAESYAGFYVLFILCKECRECLVFQVASNMQLFALLCGPIYGTLINETCLSVLAKKNLPVTGEKRQVPKLVLLLHVSQLINTNKYWTICTNCNETARLPYYRGLQRDVVYLC
jgi:hypothetical protein